MRETTPLNNISSAQYNSDYLVMESNGTLQLEYEIEK